MIAPEHIPTFIFQEFIKIAVAVARRNKLQESDVQELLGLLKKYAYEMKLPIEKKKYLNHLFSFKDEPQALVVLEPSHLKSMTHLVYEFMCECIGSVHTDKIFSISLQKTNELEEAGEFDAQRLLK